MVSDSVLVTHPFHPLAGQRLEVLGRTRRGAVWFVRLGQQGRGHRRGGHTELILNLRRREHPRPQSFPVRIPSYTRAWTRCAASM